MSGMLLLCLIWGAVTILLIGIFYRVSMLLRLPAHLRWELSPTPHGKEKESYGGSYLEDYEWWEQRAKTSRYGALLYMLKEVFLFRKVFRSNPCLWPFSFAMHLGIYFLLLSVSLSLIWAVGSLISNKAIITNLILSFAYYCGLAGNFLGVAGSLGLLVKRLLQRDFIWANDAGKICNLLLLAAVFVSGSYVGLYTEKSALRFALLIKQAISFNPRIEADFPLGIHLILFLAFCARLPLSSMSHFIAKYFIFHGVLWDDNPLNERLEKDVQYLLTQPVYWTAKHVRSGKGREWREIVAEMDHEKRHS